MKTNFDQAGVDPCVVRPIGGTDGFRAGSGG